MSVSLPTPEVIANDIKTGKWTEVWYRKISEIVSNITDMLADIATLQTDVSTLQTDIVTTQTSLASGSLSGSATDVFEATTGLWATYRYLVASFRAASHDNAAAAIGLRISINGSTFETTGYNGLTTTTTPSGAVSTTLIASGLNTNAAATHDMEVIIFNHQGNDHPFGQSWAVNSAGGGTLASISYTASASAVKGLRFYLTAGSFDAGTYTIYGVK